MINVLIVDDEKSIANLIYDALTTYGYRCKCVYDGAAAANEIETNSYNLILLDVMLPEISGFELMEYIAQFKIPVIFLTAKNAVKDKVHGLKLGAEDYIVKPFDVSELLARIEVVLRRYKLNEEILTVADVSINTSSRNVKKAGVDVDLTFKEYELLLLLIRNKGIAMYREIIYEKIWQEAYDVDTRTVDLHIQRLRKKLGLEKQIQTVYKIGYVLREQ